MKIRSRLSAFAGALALLVSLGGSLFAAGKDTGTTGAAFLKIGAGARPAAMGDAFTALADDVNAVAWNPAGLSKVTTPQFTASHGKWLQEFDNNFVAAAHPFSWGTLGMGLNSLSLDKIDKRAGDTDAPDGTFSSNDTAYTVVYGKSLGETWSMGLGASYLRQELDGRTATGLAGSAGLLWKTPHQPLTVALTARNVGSGMKFEDQSDPLPMTVTVGFGYNLMGDRLHVGLDARRLSGGGGAPLGLGAEFVQPFSPNLSGAIRAGYNKAASDVTDGVSGISSGFGIAWKSWGFDMAWVPYGVLGQTFRYALLVKF